MVDEKINVLMIHGAETFNNRKDYLNYLRTKNLRLGKKSGWWGDYLERELGDDFLVTYPRMPLEDNAHYEDWKILFGRYLEKLGGRIILMGRSLGGTFLVRYLSENVLSKKVISVYLTAPAFDDTLLDGNVTSGFEPRKDLSLIMKNCGRVVLMFSSDDGCVPISHAEKYRRALPGAEIFVYDDKNGHFKVEEFPEIVEMIRGDAGLGKGK